MSQSGHHAHADRAADDHRSELTRIEAFSDGVMAVLITIMAFELRPPATPTLAGLEAQLPSLLVYILSFTFIGIYWNNHHHLMRIAAHLNGGVMWANLHLLFWISLIPLVTLWVRQAYTAPLAAAAYGVIGLLAGAAFRILILTLIQANGRESALARAVARDRKGLGSLVIYAAGVLIAFFNPWISYALYALVAIMWLVPDPRLARSATHRH